MIGFLRVLAALAAVEAVAVAGVYLSLTRWRDLGRTGWFLAMLGLSLAYMLVLSVLSWWVDPPIGLWIPGLVVLDIALALQLSLLLRRHRRAREDAHEPQ